MNIFSSIMFSILAFSLASIVERRREFNPDRPLFTTTSNHVLEAVGVFEHGRRFHEWKAGHGYLGTRTSFVLRLGLVVMLFFLWQGSAS